MRHLCEIAVWQQYFKFACFKVELMFSIWFQSWLNYPPCLERKRAIMENTDGDRYLKYNTQTEPLSHSFHFLYVGPPAILSEGVLPENHSLAPLHLPGMPWNQSKLNLTSGSCRTGFSLQHLNLSFFPRRAFGVSGNSHCAHRIHCQIKKQMLPPHEGTSCRRTHAYRNSS